MREVPVEGGSLVVEVSDGDSPPVLAVHGISSQRRLWDWLRVEGPELRLVAPDLRGRGDSVGVTGPSSVAQHARDLLAVLDALGLDAVDVCGMSMGGFVAVELATRFPDRVRGLVLVDGGFPMATPQGLTREMLPVVFRDRLARLDRTWDSVEDYLDFFVASTAPLLDRADPVLLGYLAHDLRDGRVRLSAEAVVSDADGIFFGESSWEGLTVPVRFLHAEWSVGAGSSPGYPPELVDRYTPACISVDYLEGLDHAGTIMSARGAAATARVLRQALA